MQNSTRHLIAAPTAAVLSVSDLKVMLGLGATEDDDLLEAMIGAVVATMDPAAGGWLGRALAPQTWELRLAQFPCGEFELPYPVLTELVSVKYDDGDGVEQTLTADTDYRVFGLGGHDRATVAPVYNGSWPASRTDREAVRVRYVCGYAAADMPEPIKAAVALGVKSLRSTSERNLFLAGDEIPGVRKRSWTVSANATAVITQAIDGLLSTYRVWG